MSFDRVVQRVRRPTLQSGHNDVALEQQDPWTWAVGLPYRVLTAPFSGAVMPENPRKLLDRDEYGVVQGDFDHAIGYFASLQSFLSYSLGWTRHDKGLIWWFDNGHPVADRRFALIRETWLADGLLDRYLAWCVRYPSISAFDVLDPRVDRSPLVLTAAWEQRVRGLQTEAESDDLSTRPDQMHLQQGDHISGPSAGPVEAGLVGVDTDSRSGVLISETVAGWYSALARYGNELPPLPPGRSWHVDVHVKPIGYLGTYRKSRDTGLWFSGRHALHLVGN